MRNSSHLLLPVLISIIYCISNNGYSRAQALLGETQSCQTEFVWRGDTINGQWEPHAFMLLPVRLPSCPKQLYMQFDLGAQVSLLYREALQTIHNAYPETLEKVDSILYDFIIDIGTTKVVAKRIAVESTDGKESDIIGTIGVDLIKGHLSSIDYPQRMLYVGNQLLQHHTAPDNWTAFKFLENRILLPAIIKKKICLLYFDSGSSSFELITNKEICEQLRQPLSQPQIYNIQSWYGMMKAYTYPTNEEIIIGGKTLPIGRVTVMNGANKEMAAQLKQTGISGMIGNKFFLNYQLWLNTQNLKFALTK
jgi:hypothetical protein